MHPEESAPPSWDVVIMSLVIVGLAGLIVPPSLSRPGLTPFERTLAQSSLPLLLGAFVVVLVALALSSAGFAVAGGRVTMLGLLMVNLAGFLSGRYGIEGAGLMATLIVPAPFLGVLIQREVATFRRRASTDSALPNNEMQRTRHG